MKFVAFFRNLNLGRPPAPTRLRFEEAFLCAGARSAESFLTNGTLVFDAATRGKAKTVLAGACAALGDDSGFREPAFLRELGYLSSLVDRDPFASIDPTTVYERCITFLHADLELSSAPPRQSARNDVQVVEYTPSELLSVVHKLGASPGSPNAFAERHFGLPATTRAWNTVCRLVTKYA